MSDKRRQSRHRRSRGRGSQRESRIALKYGSIGALTLLGLGAAVLADATTWRAKEISATNPSRVLWSRYDTVRSPQEVGALSSDAKALLRSEPLNVGAASLIATLEALEGRAVEADQLMSASFQLNKRDFRVNSWLFARALQEKQYNRAFLHADFMLRRSQQDGPSLYSVLVDTTGDPAAVAPLAQMLKDAPWREPFFQAAIADARTHSKVPVLFSAIIRAGGAVQPSEIGRHIQALIADGRYADARQAWLQFNPIADRSRIGNVYDQDFEGWPPVFPFAWILGTGITGAIEDLKPIGRQGKGLHISYDGVSSALMPRQMIMLAPGHYRLSGEHFATSEEAGGRLQWTVTCVDAPLPIVQQEVEGPRNDWKRFAADFNVPDNCPAQWLALLPIRGDRRASVDVWFDRVSIDRMGVAS